MFTYKFQKGKIRTGIMIDLATNNESIFEKNYGKFLKVYNDGEHNDEELEFVYAFMKTIERVDDEDDCELILTKDKDKISEMEMSDEYTLADMHFVLSMCEGNVPINFYCADGHCTLVLEEYIKKDGSKNKSSNYLSVSWI